MMPRYGMNGMDTVHCFQFALIGADVAVEPTWIHDNRRRMEWSNWHLTLLSLAIKLLMATKDNKRGLSQSYALSRNHVMNHVPRNISSQDAIGLSKIFTVRYCECQGLQKFFLIKIKVLYIYIYISGDFKKNCITIWMIQNINLHNN